MVVFEQSRLSERLGKTMGYLFAYFMFTTILYFVLDFAKKLPYSWSYIYIMGVTAIIALIGAIINWSLK